MTPSSESIGLAARSCSVAAMGTGCQSIAMFPMTRMKLRSCNRETDEGELSTERVRYYILSTFTPTTFTRADCSKAPCKLAVPRTHL